MVAVEETRQSQFFSFLQQNSSANDGNSSIAQSRGARCSAWRTFHTARSISRRISQNPSRVASDKRNVQRNDVQALGRRLFTFDEFIFSSYVEIDVSKLFSQQSRTCLPLRSCRYNVYNSRYQRSKFPYFYTLIDCTLRRLLPNVERLA